MSAPVEPFRGIFEEDLRGFFDHLPGGKYGVAFKTTWRQIAPGCLVPETEARVVDDASREGVDA